MEEVASEIKLFANMSFARKTIAAIMVFQFANFDFHDIYMLVSCDDDNLGI